MVVSARLAAGLSGLRNRNARVTNKTQLHVVRGSIESDTILLDDEDEKNRILASQGVDEEDANEHHLQAALFASSQRALSTANYKSYNSKNDSKAYIPTPDATGLVSEYDTLYPSGRYKEPATHLRYSDSLDESCVGGLSGGYTYFLDERDAEWLERNNGSARGEGTSASGGINGANGSNHLNGTNGLVEGSPGAPHGRSMKAKGKEPEQHLPGVAHESSMVINEDHFELVMGLFEKWTDEAVSPYLYVTHDLVHFPAFPDYERFFSTALSPTVFANFTIPANLPSTDQMVQLATTIYPWWRERRIEKLGHRIVPQLNVLIIEAQEKEDKTGGSPYICFRKRDVKPMRKTRTNNVTHIEKFVRLRGELQTSLELAQMVLQREKLKNESAIASQSVWRCRESLAENMKQLASLAPGSTPPGDELLLFDKERKPRKSKVETNASGRIIITNRRLSQARAGLAESPDPHSPLALNADTSYSFDLCQKGPGARVAAIHREIDQELTKARKDDVYWEDILDVPFQSTPTFGGEKFFRRNLSSVFDRNLTSSTSLSTPEEQQPSSRASRTPRSARLRVGRGGRLHFDRKLHISQPHRLLQREWAWYPPRMAGPSSAAPDDAERWASRSWRPRHEASRDVLLRRREHQLGEQYWAHPSVYDSQREPGVVNHTSGPPPKEVQNSIIGYEHSGFDWDGYYGPRGPWEHARISEDEGCWKPTPYLTADLALPGVESTTGQRDRLVEAWRDRTVEESGNGGGGALALFMDGDAMEINGEQNEMPQDRDDGQNHVAGDGDSEMADRAWRIEERWRYDYEGGQQGQDADDRFLLDDFQPKFLRTTIKLLDAQDQEALADPEVLKPPPLKQNRYLDHQLRMHNTVLPQSSAPPTIIAKPHLPRRMSIPPRPTASSLPLKNGKGVHPPLSLSPAQNLPRPANGNNVSSTTRIVTSPMPPNGTTTLGLTPGGARLPPDSSGTGIRVGTPVRTKHSPVNGALPQPAPPAAFSPGTANANGDVGSQGPFQLHSQTTPSYPSLKTTFGRVLSQQPQGRVLQQPVSNNANGVNSGDITSMHPIGATNAPPKFPNQRMTQIRATGKNPNISAPTETPGTDHYSQLQQQLALARHPSNGSRAA